MKKIAILTHYYGSKNLGGLLQSYALVQVLLSRGFATQQLSFSRETINKEKKELSRNFHLQQMSFSSIATYPVRRIKYLLQRINKHRIIHQLQQQDSICQEFEQFIPHSSTIYNDDNIARANSNYEVFVIGSDQVFSLPLLPLSAFYGTFTSSDKKVISYAASSDRKQFPPEAEKLFIKKLKRMNAISVREKTLKEYIEHITDQPAVVVLDPTFLLSSHDWLQIANPVAVPQKPYIFCYFLGEKSAWQRQKAQAYADKYGYEVVHTPYILHTVRSADKYLKGQGRYDIGPREFIALIANAACIFTDSFHGLAFSINFGKNFYVFNRDDQYGSRSMSARITDTLETFGLTARHITDKKVVLDSTSLGFTKAHKILAREKEKSINWLLKALGE